MKWLWVPLHAILELFPKLFVGKFILEIHSGLFIDWSFEECWKSDWSLVRSTKWTAFWRWVTVSFVRQSEKRPTHPAKLYFQFSVGEVVSEEFEVGFRNVSVFVLMNGANKVDQSGKLKSERDKIRFVCCPHKGKKRCGHQNQVERFGTFPGLVKQIPRTLSWVWENSLGTSFEHLKNEVIHFAVYRWFQLDTKHLSHSCLLFQKTFAPFVWKKRSMKPN